MGRNAERLVDSTVIKKGFGGKINLSLVAIGDLQEMIASEWLYSYSVFTNKFETGKRH